MKHNVSRPVMSRSLDRCIFFSVHFSRRDTSRVLDRVLAHVITPDRSKSTAPVQQLVAEADYAAAISP